MANKREFKKAIAAVGGAICNDMMTVAICVDGVDRNAIDAAISRVLSATENAIERSNIFFDKGRRAFPTEEEYIKAKRAFFKQLFDKIHKEYTAVLDETIKQFNAAIPAAAKEANKA